MRIYNKLNFYNYIGYKLFKINLKLFKFKSSLCFHSIKMNNFEDAIHRDFTQCWYNTHYIDSKTLDLLFKLLKFVDNPELELTFDDCYINNYYYLKNIDYKHIKLFICGETESNSKILLRDKQRLLVTNNFYDEYAAKFNINKCKIHERNNILKWMKAWRSFDDYEKHKKITDELFKTHFNEKELFSKIYFLPDSKWKHKVGYHSYDHRPLIFIKKNFELHLKSNKNNYNNFAIPFHHLTKSTLNYLTCNYRKIYTIHNKDTTMFINKSLIKRRLAPSNLFGIYRVLKRISNEKN